MRSNMEDINGWLYHRIRMCIWKQWKLPRTKKRNLIKMGVHEYYANMAANCRRGHWYCANLTTVKKAMTKERLINSGFYDLATAYQSVHVNYWNRRVPNGTHGGVRGRELVTPSYSIPKAWLHGLFRALHSHNPSRYSHIVGLTSHFYAHIGAWPKVILPPLCKHRWENDLLTL